MQLVSEISNLCDHKSPTSQTDRQTDRRTDGRTDGQHAIPRPRICYALRSKKEKKKKQKDLPVPTCSWRLNRYLFISQVYLLFTDRATMKVVNWQNEIVDFTRRDYRVHLQLCFMFTGAESVDNSSEKCKIF